MKKRAIFSLLVCLSFFVSSCNGDETTTEMSIPEIYTAAALTITAQNNIKPSETNEPTTTATETKVTTQTQTVTVTSKAESPVATISYCDNAVFAGDVNIPDGTAFSPGVSFTKTWKIKNIGTCTWSPAYSLVYYSGASFNGTPTSLTYSVEPGDTVNLSVSMTAPDSNGSYLGYWVMKNAAGYTFGQKLSIQIVVADATSTFTPTITSTDDGSSTSTPTATTAPTNTPIIIVVTATPEPTDTKPVQTEITPEETITENEESSSS